MMRVLVVALWAALAGFGAPPPAPADASPPKKQDPATPADPRWSCTRDQDCILWGACDCKSCISGNRSIGCVEPCPKPCAKDPCAGQHGVCRNGTCAASR
jgi:hypothetical protein